MTKSVIVHAMLSRAFAYRILPAIDGVFLMLGLVIALGIRYGSHALMAQFSVHALPFVIVFSAWLFILRINDMYHPYESLDIRKILEGSFRSLLVGVSAAVIFFYAFPVFGITPRKNLLLIGGIALIIIILWRYVFAEIIKRYAPLKIFLIGGAPEITEVAAYIQSRPQLGINVEQHPEITPAMVSVMSAAGRNYYVVIPESVKSSGEQMKRIYALLPSGVQLLDFAALHERLYHRIPVSLITELWFLEHIAEGKKPIYSGVKRIIDIVIGLIVGTITLVLFPFIAFAIKINSKGPVILPNHYRVGQNGKIFQLYKFRSMEDNAEKHGPQWTQHNDPRITRIGKYLRELRIDELPQVFNILRGDLSFVGPRPERPEFVAELRKEIPFYDMRHLVKPGLSGWAQTNPPFYYTGTTETIIKLQYDLYYIKNRSMILDLSVLLNTIVVLFSRLGR